MVKNLNSLYQEKDSTFESDGKAYDLNFFLKETRNSPVLYINVSKLKWILEFVDYSSVEDKKRTEQSDVTVPLLITKYKNDELVVDGLHRLIKAIQLNTKRLPYKRISEEIFKKGLITTSLEARSGLFNW